jgi:hypothetical protein
MSSRYPAVVHLFASVSFHTSQIAKERVHPCQENQKR